MNSWVKTIKSYEILNYIEHLSILVSTVTGCVFISAFASLVGVPEGITKYWIEKLCNNYRN